MQTPKSAIVTGAASGLGRAIAVALARRGWRVAIADVDLAGSQQTAEMVDQAGGQGRVEALDVSDSAAWQRLRDRLQTDWPALDLLVNNAGVGMGADIDQWSLDDWRWIININLYGAIYGCHTMLPWMKQNPAGAHLVNVASMAAIASPPGLAPYNLTKAGLFSFSETLYGELRRDRIGVTVVCPAHVPTNLVVNGRYPDQRQRQFDSRLMSASKATPELVAERTLKAIDKKQLYVFVPRSAGIVWRLKRLMPLTLLKMVAAERQQPQPDA